jgi:hypothetical protein
MEAPGRKWKHLEAFGRNSWLEEMAESEWEGRNAHILQFAPGANQLWRRSNLIKTSPFRT